jgi:hypothetical protein
MKPKHFAATLVFAIASLAEAGDVPSVVARGHKIAIGDTADSVFAVLKKEDMVSQDVEKFSTGLKLTKRYKVDGRSFGLVFARAGMEGPYTVARIDAQSNTAPSSNPGTTSNLIASTKAFEATDFYRKHSPTKKSWPLATGGRNTSYSFADTENPYTSVSVEITESKSGPSEFAIIWYGKSTLSPARMTKTKEAFLRDFLHAAASTVNAEGVIKYIKKVGSKNYEDGSNAMPRTTISGMHVFSGSVGESLMVGLAQ